MFREIKDKIENFCRELETLKNQYHILKKDIVEFLKILELKNTLTAIKNSRGKYNTRLDIAKKMINELEGRPEDNIKNESQEYETMENTEAIVRSIEAIKDVKIHAMRILEGSRKRFEQKEYVEK